jgi:DNA helicase-2/ATP-dependent DNA helicase PcrA
MIRGETQYNKMSRFLKEIPMDLLSNGAVFQRFAEKEKEIKMSTYQQARQSFKQQAYTAKPLQQFAVSKGKGLDYGVGDRVRHMKFGAGTVLNVTEGGRDYEVTVEFDAAGTKKMFAAFAKLQKI